MNKQLKELICCLGLYISVITAGCWKAKVLHFSRRYLLHCPAGKAQCIHRDLLHSSNFGKLYANSHCWPIASHIDSAGFKGTEPESPKQRLLSYWLIIYELLYNHVQLNGEAVIISNFATHNYNVDVDVSSRRALNAWHLILPKQGLLNWNI